MKGGTQLRRVPFALDKYLRVLLRVEQRGAKERVPGLHLSFRHVRRVVDTRTSIVVCGDTPHVHTANDSRPPFQRLNVAHDVSSAINAAARDGEDAGHQAQEETRREGPLHRSVSALSRRLISA